ncbi:MAG TPA: hypothetical protein VJN92_17875 [Candidatus Acidoferrum sp.]|nr:hypothetical protein [Candidatus Acidoferrum sp.]
MRRIHLITGLLGVIAFLLTGQVMKHHNPRMEELSAEVRMMYVSRHIYLLGASLVNVVLGLYLQVHRRGWRRVLQQIASVVILLSPLALLIAFFAEPAFGLAGRSWRSYFGLIGLFAGVMTHTVTRAGLSSALVSKK